MALPVRPSSRKAQPPHMFPSAKKTSHHYISALPPGYELKSASFEGDLFSVIRIAISFGAHLYTPCMQRMERHNLPIGDEDTTCTSASLISLFLHISQYGSTDFSICV